MPDPSTVATHVRFGPFTLDVRAGELRKGATRLKVPDQSIEILKALLERPGELVSRDELRQRLWPANHFVDFEHGLNAAVRRLRDALGDSADTPKYIETLPRKGYRFISAIDQLNTIAPPAERGATARDVRSRSWLLAPALGALIALVLLAVYVIRRPPPAESFDVQPRRVSFAPGLQTQPTFSPDGASIAYASNQGGNFDIWIQAMPNGKPVRITADSAHDWQPDWSPDGKRIVFRSEREDGGLYLVPATGGHEILLWHAGYQPRWSPDGTSVLFVNLALGLGGRGAVYTIGLNGHPPNRVDSALLSRLERLNGAVGWHPGGGISFAFSGGGGEGFSLASIGPGPADFIRSHVDPAVLKAFVDLRMRIIPTQPIAWDPDGTVLYFVARSRGLFNVWSVDVEPRTLAVTGGPHRITTMPEANDTIAISRRGEYLAFGVANRNPRIATYTLRRRGTQLTGPAVMESPPDARAYAPDLTRDGTKLLFQIQQPGTGLGITELRISSHADPLAVDDFWARHEFRATPRWSRDAKSVVYAYVRDVAAAGRSANLRSLVLHDVASGRARDLTTPFAGVESADDWTTDGHSIVASGRRFREGQNAIALLPLSAAPHAELKATVVAAHGEYELFDAVLSPDGRWICFSAIKGDESNLVVIPATAGRGWKWLTEGSSWSGKPRWSTDGRLIYFLARRGGFINVWALEFDLTRGTVVGVPSQITRFDGSEEQILPDIPLLALATGGDKMALPIINPMGGVWVLEQRRR